MDNNNNNNNNVNINNNINMNAPNASAEVIAFNAQPIAAQVQQQINNINNNNNNNNNNQFGAVRDRLFHAMLVRMALSYTRHVPRFGRRFIEFFVLLIAILLLCLMIYVHIIFNRNDSRCLSDLIDKWPRDGVLRVEVISDLHKFYAYQDRAFERWNNEQKNSTEFSLKRILQEGPKALPKELRKGGGGGGSRQKVDHWSSFLSGDDSILNIFSRSDYSKSKKKFLFDDYNYYGEDGDLVDYYDESFLDDEMESTFEYVVEYSLHYGLLRLSHSYRVQHNIPFVAVRLDATKEECFGDVMSRFIMKHLIGYEDILMASIKALAENETDKGYLRDLISGEHYRFVTIGNAKASYITALVVMLIFTFTISMLLRFSHHQIFLFIIDLLQMFELNQTLTFPAAPLLTVILALVGMEAIMTEVFNDTSTAFYVILLVWIADQYDAICCHSTISKRYWLRFFYLYHFGFYAYQYRYNGQYGGLALLASTFFILHSMIFFFHHYELPLILYHERIQRIITDIQHNNIATPEQQQQQQQQGQVVTDTNGTAQGVVNNNGDNDNVNGDNNDINNGNNINSNVNNNNNNNNNNSSDMNNDSGVLMRASAGEIVADQITENAMNEIFNL